MDKIRESILREVESILKILIDDEIEYNMETKLLGESHILDSVTAIQLVAWGDEYYGINVLEGDMELKCLQTVGEYVERVYSMIKYKTELY